MWHLQDDQVSESWELFQQKQVAPTEVDGFDLLVGARLSGIKCSRRGSCWEGYSNQCVSVVMGSMHHQVTEHADPARWPREGGANS